MEFRHLRCFVAAAETPHFARAAEQLHMDQSPLSRTIKELETELGISLFKRNTRNKEITRAGEILLKDARQIMGALDQAKGNMRSLSQGFLGALRVAISDDVNPLRMADILAACREEEPEVDVQLFEVSHAEQIEGLKHERYDIGLSHSPAVEHGMMAECVWQDPIVVGLPARHPLLVHKAIPLTTMLHYPVVNYHPDHHSGSYRQIQEIYLAAEKQPDSVKYSKTPELILALVCAGYGLCLMSQPRLESIPNRQTISRPLAGCTPFLNTFLLRNARRDSVQIKNFVFRAALLHKSE